jgi:hypothetical protein
LYRSNAKLLTRIFRKPYVSVSEKISELSPIHCHSDDTICLYTEMIWISRLRASEASRRSQSFTGRSRHNRMDNTARATRERHFSSSQPKRLLALDGGGVRGIISLAFLERIENILAERTEGSPFCLADYFDLVGGVSTGAIIATGIALGRSTAELIDLYLNMSRQTFKPRYFMGGTFASKFDSAALRHALNDKFGNESLGSDNLRCGLGIVAKRLDTGSVWLFHNHPQGPFFSPESDSQNSVPNRDLLLVDLLCASTAAPTYFAPEVIRVSPKTTGLFVDGGVSPHSNPALLMMMLASLKGYGFRWPVGSDRLSLTSIGTGSPQFKLDARSFALKPALLLAIASLQSLMDDCNWLTQTLMQWLGETPTRWHMDSEIGDLADDSLESPLVHYLRYDAYLSHEWLQQRLGLMFTPAKLARLQRMDLPYLAPELLEIGRQAAELQVKAEHFPVSFDGKNPTS